MNAKTWETVAIEPRSAGPRKPVPARGRVVAIAANTAWNLAHFRRPIIERLVADGVRVAAIARADGHEARLSSLGADFHPVPIDPAGRSPLADLRLLVSLAALLRRLRPAAMLTFTVKPNVYGGLAARLTGVPLVPTVTGLGSSFLAGGALERLVGGLYRASFAHARTVLFQNPVDRQEFVDRGIVPAGRARLVAGSGVDLERFAPQELPAGHRFAFLLIGRLLRDKGIAEYAKAASILRSEGRDAAFRIVGERRPDNPSAVPDEEVERWIADGLVEHRPPVEDIRAEIAAADCIVLPSYREGLPRSLLEGMAMARPLVASDVPGCRELVEDGVNGLLCAPRSAPDLARAMRAMMDLAPARRSAMGRQGRAVAERAYGEDRVVDVYLAELER